MKLLRWIFLRPWGGGFVPVGGELKWATVNHGDVFTAKAELELNKDTTCQREPLEGNPIIGNPAAQRQERSSSRWAATRPPSSRLPVLLLLLALVTVVLPHHSCGCQGLGGATTPAGRLPPKWTERIAQDINASPCQLPFRVSTVSPVLFALPGCHLRCLVHCIHREGCMHPHCWRCCTLNYWALAEVCDGILEFDCCKVAAHPHFFKKQKQYFKNYIKILLWFVGLSTKWFEAFSSSSHKISCELPWWLTEHSLTILLFSGLVMWPPGPLIYKWQKKGVNDTLQHTCTWIRLKNQPHESIKTVQPYFAFQLQLFPSPVCVAIFRFWSVLEVTETQLVPKLHAPCVETAFTVGLRAQESVTKL